MEGYMFKASTVLKLIAALAVMIGMMGALAPTTAAQTICRNEPTLGLVDSDGDGVATTGEIRALAPDNAELQSVAGQLEAQGITGIQYSGCTEGENGGGNGDGNGGGADNSGDSGDDTGTGTEGGGDGTGSDDASGDGSGNGGAEGGTGGNSGQGGNAGDGTGSGGSSVTGVPNTGSGSTIESGQPMLVVAFGAVAALALAASLLLRGRRTA